MRVTDRRQDVAEPFIELEVFGATMAVFRCRDARPNKINAYSASMKAAKALEVAKRVAQEKGGDIWVNDRHGLFPPTAWN